jgi:hypothetical protein
VDKIPEWLCGIIAPGCANRERFGPESKKVLYLAIEDLQKGGRAI